MFIGEYIILQMYAVYKGMQSDIAVLTIMVWNTYACIFFLIWISSALCVKVDLTNQGLEAVPRNLSTGISALILDQNIFVTLNSNSFDIYVRLKRISLQRCQTSCIEDGTFDNQYQLAFIRLDHCHIMQLPQSFGPSTTTMKEFSLYGGYGSNSIFKLPYFAAFPHLERLNLGGSNLISFDAVIIPTNVQRLRLDRAKLETFPDFRNQTILEVLTVTDNYISIIPQAHIDTLYRLITFQADGNKIIQFPNFSHMKNLRSLDMNDNSIPLIPHEHIRGLESLQNLTTTHNLVQMMPNISYLLMLQSADFSNNLIRYVPASCLYGLPMIQSLHLNGNIITHMDDNSLATGYLYLHDNQLESAPDLYDMKFASLTLRGNPLVCNQLLCWLRMWPFNKTLPQLDMVYCASPSALNGSLVMDVHPKILRCYQGRSQ